MPRSRGRTGRPYRRLRARVQRTQGVCHLCGHPIDPTLQWPHPYSFTLDHVEPLSHNEERALDKTNAKAAHFLCNIRKGNRATIPDPNSQPW